MSRWFDLAVSRAREVRFGRSFHRCRAESRGFMVGWVGDDEGFESSFIFICGWAGGLECFPDFPSSSLVAVLLFVAHVLPGIPMFYPFTNSCATPLEKK